MSSRPFARAWTMWRAAVPVRRAKYPMRSGRSTAYAAELTLRAARDLDYLYRRINAAESMAAARWYNGLEKALYSLERFPRRTSLPRLGASPKDSSDEHANISGEAALYVAAAFFAASAVSHASDSAAYSSWPRLLKIEAASRRAASACSGS